ncbi:MAG: hypothetical protein MK025_02430 [Acidobacteriia bacterium]|nr:hypothetical protein [Terriglobia bacterium]
MGLIVITIVTVACAMLLMAIGLFFKRPCLRGSCGGTRLFGEHGEILNCDACPNHQNHLPNNISNHSNSNSTIPN